MRPWTVYARLACTAVGLLLGLTGCPNPAMLKTVTVMPTSTDGTNGGYQSQYNQNFWCKVPLPGQGFFLNGLGPATLPGGQVYSGYEDIFNSGPGPFPCQEEQQTLYRGHIQFDFSPWDVIVSATLNFNIAQSENATAGSLEVPANSYASVLGMSTGQVNGSNGPFFWPYDNDTGFPSCIPSIIKPDCTVGVSQQVRQWVSGAHQNFGFMFAGPILNLPQNPPQDNNAQLTWYSNFSIDVLYDPSKNPRAPQ